MRLRRIWERLAPQKTVPERDPAGSRLSMPTVQDQTAASLPAPEIARPAPDTAGGPLRANLSLDPVLRNQIRRSFDDASQDEEHFPSTIDPRIQHVRVLLEFFGPIEGRMVLDVGCGKGRFARVLLEQNPAARIWGLDISQKMLRHVPKGVNAAAGSMTELPFEDAVFDCVYATESLEHAVEIEKAVDEMCRVLKPGGKLVIIDKNAERWGELETPPWERWFGRKELEKLLARNCYYISSRFLSYWDDVQPDGLFLAWLAVK